MAAKKTTKKAAPARTASRTTASSSATAANRARSKGDVYRSIAEDTGLSRKQVGEVFDCMKSLIERDLSKKGPGVFAVPGLMKLKAVHKPATKATTKANPFKPGEMMDVKAKPASMKVTARFLKGLKDQIK